VLRSRLPRIAAELPLKADAVTEVAAGLIADRAKDRVPVASGKLRDAIHTERVGNGEHAVVAGNTEAFYGHIVEYGSVNVPPHPFLIPAAEESRKEIEALAVAAGRTL
jgi:HK97 gp10 family phage protein